MDGDRRDGTDVLSVGRFVYDESHRVRESWRSRMWSGIIFFYIVPLCVIFCNVI